MNVRPTSDTVRHVICTAQRIRHTSTTALSHVKKAKQPEPGKEIWVYHHFQKNQVVYSLTKALNVRPSTNYLRICSSAIIYIFLPQTSSSKHYYRTTPPCANSPLTAKRPSPEPSARTTGTRSQKSAFNKFPLPSAFPSSKNCASIANGTNTNGMTRSGLTKMERG